MAKKKPIVTNAMRQLTAAKIDFEAIEYETDGVIEDNFGMLYMIYLRKELLF